MLAISILTFFIVQFPHVQQGWGSYAQLYQNYLDWISSLLRGNIYPYQGVYGRITIELADRMLLTVIVAMSALLLMWVTAIPLGIYSALRQRSVGDYTLRFLGFIGISVPDFMLALILMYFAWYWFDYDIGGLFSRDYLIAPWSLGRIVDLLAHLPIPVLVLGTSGMASLIRIMRANLLDEIPKPYVVTARARGLSELRLVLKYPVRLALNPMISTVGYTLPWLISGTIIVSIVLNLYTVGPPLLAALMWPDMYFAGFIILFLGLLTIIGTLLSDILLAIVDPRTRLDR